MVCRSHTQYSVLVCLSMVDAECGCMDAIYIPLVKEAVGEIFVVYAQKFAFVPLSDSVADCCFCWMRGLAVSGLQSGSKRFLWPFRFPVGDICFAVSVQRS